jgi:hypothetical protein
VNVLERQKRLEAVQSPALGRIPNAVPRRRIEDGIDKVQAGPLT